MKLPKPTRPAPPMPTTKPMGFESPDTVEINRLRSELVTANQRAKDWENCFFAANDLVKIIGGILGADTPRQLVTDIAHERMEELATLRAENAHLKLALALALAEALRNKEKGFTV